MTSSKTFNRLLSMLLLVCMLMSLMPATAFADDSVEPEEAAITELAETAAEAETAEEAAESALEEEPAAVVEDEPAEEPAAVVEDEPAEEPADPVPTEPADPVPTEPADPVPTEPADPEPAEPTDPEPADTNWTMALPFTAGTLTGSGASFANLTLDFSPADASIGRTIDAYWIGFEFIAPAAVTAENIGKTTFTMDGSNWLSFDASKDGQNADGTYYMYAWVPLTVESVKTLVAGQQSKSWTFSFAWDGDTANAQSFVITASPENITLVKDGQTQIKVENWEITELNESFTVTFDSDGGSAVEAQSVPFGGTAVKPEDPTREHYVFQGWFTKDGEAYDFAAPVKADLTLIAQWKGEEMRVVYTDGVGHILKTYTASYGDPTPVYDGETPVREGYRFADKEGEQSWSPAIEETVTRNTVYTAQWVKLVTLHFDVNGGDSTTKTDVVLDEGTVYSLNVSSSNAKSEEKQFLGWSANAEAAEPEYYVYYEGVKTLSNRYYDVTVSADMTLYAVWGTKWHLSIDGNAGDDEVRNLQRSDNANNFGTWVYWSNYKPSRTGYTFTGWSFDAEGKEPVTGFAANGWYKIDKDVTIYANWEANTYTLSYDLNGGEGTVPESVSFTLADKKDVVLPAAEGLTKEGREFLGWSFGSKITDLGWNKELSASQKKNFYEAGATLPADVLTAANKTVYAVWKKLPVTENVDLNGGTKGPSGFPKTVDYGTSWSLPLMTTSFYKDIDAALTEDGSVKNYIRAWYVVNDGTVHPHGNTAAGAAGKLTLTEDTTIMALYEYTVITFVDGEEELGKAVSRVIYSKDVYTFPAGDAVTPATVIEAPEKLHYVFKGWAESADGEVKYQPGDSVAFLSDTTLYAIYEDAPYTLTYDLNGGKGEVPAVEHYSAGDEVEIPEIELERPHYSFTGWADGEGNVYQPGDVLTFPEANVVLTAQWKGDEHTIIYADGEGGMLAVLTAEYGSATPTIDNPTREGYRFDKWDPAVSETVTGDVVYTAQWVKTYTLHFEGYDSFDITVDAGQTASFSYVVGGLGQKYVLADTDDQQFLGWDKDPEVAHDQVGCARFTNGQSDTNKGPFSFEMKEDITLYPIFGAKYVLTAMHNDGTDNHLNTNDAKPGTFARLMIGTRPTRSGFILLGYSRNAEATEPDADLVKLKPNSTNYVYIYLTEDTTIYAVWEAIPYTLSFDLNGGEGTKPEDIEFTLDAKPEIVLPAAEGYSKEGRVFLGWSFGTKISDLSWDKDLSASQKKTFYEPGATIPTDVITAANKTIYAVWKYTSVVESVDLNGGTKGPSGFPKTVNYGTTWSLPLMTTSFYKDVTLPDGSAAKNYIRGWYVLNDGTVHPHGNTAAGANGKLTLTEDTTIVALYQYTLVTFMDGEEVLGTAVSEASYSIPVYTFPESDAIVPATLIAAPEKTGYTFKGWALEEGGEPVYQAGETLAPLSDTVLYAVYEINQYTLHFDLNGGDSTVKSDVVRDYGTDYSLMYQASDAAREGYQFLGWAWEADAKEPDLAIYKVGLTTLTPQYTHVLFDADKTLYAVWGVNYTLTFDGNTDDETLKNVPKPVSGTYVRGSTTKPSRTGYTFKGWSYTPDGAELTTDFTKSSFYRIDKDTTIYAIWEAIEYTVSFDLNGGNGTVPEDVVFTLATKADIKLPAAEGYTKDGRIFLGWSYGTKISDLAWNKELTASNLKTFYEPGATIPADALANANKTVYAVWKYLGVTENIDLNGGTKGPSGFPKTVNYGTSWSLPLMTTSFFKDIDAALTVDGSVKNYIRGWFVVNDGTVHPHGNMAAGESGKLTLTEDTTIMALYEYTVITFVDGEEELGKAVSRVIYSIPVYTFPEGDAVTPATLIDAPEKTGCTFKGWALEEGGEPVYQAGDTLAVLSDTTLYAVYEVNQYTVTFDPNGGDSAPEAATVDYGTVVTLEEAVRAQYDFLGWATAADASEAAYAAGDEITVTEDLTLFALWKHSAGWAKNEEGKWNYYDEDGEKLTGWLETEEASYYLDENGDMVSGWQEIDGETYWFYPGGSMKTGWKEIDGEWYYFDEDGKLLTGWVETYGNAYYLGEDGKMLTGWQKLDGKWYFFNEESGAMYRRWKQIDETWYYFGEDGVMRTGWQEINGKWYYLQSSGAMKTGWLQYNNRWYYFQTDGAMKTGWLKDGGYWYYFVDSGAMAVSTTLNIDGVEYSFDASGHML